MEYIVTSNEMKMYDYNTINHFGVSSLVLMERAAVSVCECIMKKKELHKILVLCGAGNNGGDGFAIARILFTKGYDVKILFAGKQEKMTEETKAQFEIVDKYGITVKTATDISKENNTKNNIYEEKFDCIVDSLFGVSLNRNIEGIYYDVIEKVNALEGYKVAVDLPSGISADSGMVLGIAFKADVTVTFAFKKAGLYLGDAKEYCGEIVLSDIGISGESFLSQIPKGFSYSEEALSLIPKRKQTANKGSFGKLLVIAGSHEMMGAALLCSMSAYRSGCGYVRVLTEKSNKEAIVTRLPEAVVSTYEDGALDLEIVKQACDFADTIVMGPGLSKSDTAREIVEYVLSYVSDYKAADSGNLSLSKGSNHSDVKHCKPLVIDADAINIISESEVLRNILANREGNNPIILTPHLLELSRLIQRPIPEIKDHLLQISSEAAKKYNMILVCKDAATAVFYKDQYYINQTGNDGLATAGSGDVLAGIIGSLLAKGMEGMQAACVGALLHGLCGDYAVKNKSRSYLKAGDLIEQLQFILE